MISAAKFCGGLLIMLLVLGTILWLFRMASAMGGIPGMFALLFILIGITRNKQ